MQYRSCSEPMATICWLLLACCAQLSLALRFSRESISETTSRLQASRKDIAIILPMELSLKIRGSGGQLDYSAAVDQLLAIIRKRRGILQHHFHSEVSPTGFLVSNSRWINVGTGVFTMYYYAAYIGTSNFRTFSTRVKALCLTGTPKPVGNCSEVTFANSTMLNLLMLSSFKYMPKNDRNLSKLFMEFDANATGFVRGVSSEYHDVNQLLCREFLNCRPTHCNMSKIMVPWHVKNNFPWHLYDRHFATNRSSAPPKASGSNELMNLKMEDVFEGSFIESKDDFGAYRSWCDSNPGIRCAASTFVVTLLAFVLVLTLLCS